MSTGENAHRMFRFGEFSLDLDREALYRGKRELHLRPKALQVLTILLKNNGRLVSKAELHSAVWTHSVVTDDSLAQCIGDIRRALGDTGFEAIKTVPRRGYIFDHAVSRDIEGGAAAPPKRDRKAYRLGAVTAGLAAAVLLLLSAGQSDEVSHAFEEAGEITVANAVDGGRWSAGIDAHNEYERGRFFFKRRGDGDIERAEKAFKAALEQEPDFAAAWIGLAGVYSVLVGHGELGREAGIPLLGDATRHAVRLAPDNAEAHARRSTYYQYVGEPRLATEHMETALALDPDDPLVLSYVAGMLAHRGRFDEAIELQRRAVRGDPTSVLNHHNLVWFLLSAGRYAEADIVAEQYHALYPAGIRDERELLVDVQILQGNYEQALVQTREMPGGPAQDRNLAIIHHALGQQAEADKALQRLFDSNDQQAEIYTAEVFARRGENDEAMQQLFNALDATSGQNKLRRDTLWLLSPYLITLRADERWQARYSEVLEARGYWKTLAQVGRATATRNQ